jgi:hypothetical protein
MKKIILSVCILSLFSSVRAEAFKIGENRASFGVGFGWINKIGDQTLGKSRNFPSPNVLVERSILPFKKLGFISIGAQFGFHYGSYKETPEQQSWTTVYFVPRAALYFHELFHEDDFPENIDLYGGIGLGFRFLSHKIPSDAEIKDNNGFKFGYNLFIGGRYYFKKHASVFAEFGHGISSLNVGITIRY